jgi:hypothetical protein
LRLAAAFDFSGLLGGARAEFNAEDRTEGVEIADIAGDAWRSGAAEPARRTGCRKPDLLVVGRVEGGLDGPGIVKIEQLTIKRKVVRRIPSFFELCLSVESLSHLGKCKQIARDPSFPPHVTVSPAIVIAYRFPPHEIRLPTSPFPPSYSFSLNTHSF